LYITYLARKKGEKEAYFNNLFNTLVLIVSITISLIIINILSLSNIAFIVFPFDYLMMGFIILFFPAFYLLIIREKKKIKIEKNESGTSTQKELPLKYDLYRKLSHLAVLGIIFFYFTLGYIIQYFFINLIDLLPEGSEVSKVFYSIFTIEGDVMIFTQYLVVFLVGISLIGLLTADIVRILKPEIYPLKPINKILREKELHMRFGPQISMVIGCFSIIIIYGLFQPIGPLIICTSMTMAIFGDIAANLIGRTLGKTKIRNTNKTYEGLFAGITVAFISGLIILIFLRGFYTLSFSGYFILPLIGCLIIGLLDYLDLELDDNLTYPFTVTTVLFYVSILIA